MIKILFICHGNICRSVLAEYLLKSFVKKDGREKEFRIESMATSDEEIGNDIYPPMKKEMIRRGLSFEKHISRRVNEEDYNRFDEIYYMDSRNFRNLPLKFQEDKDRKVKKLLGEKDVEDPWWTGNYAKVYDEIQKGVERIYEKTKGDR